MNFSMNTKLEQIVNILIDMGVDNYVDLTNILYLYQMYGIQIYDKQFIEDLEFILIDNTLQVKDIYKVNLNKPIDIATIEDEELNILKKIYKWYNHNQCIGSISNTDNMTYRTILEEQNKLFRFTYILSSILLLLLSIVVIALLTISMLKVTAH